MLFMNSSWPYFQSSLGSLLSTKKTCGGSQSSACSILIFFVKNISMRFKIRFFIALKTRIKTSTGINTSMQSHLVCDLIALYMVCQPTLLDACCWNVIWKQCKVEYCQTFPWFCTTEDQLAQTVCLQIVDTAK